MENIEITKEWDKVFPKSDNVNHEKVTFKNRYGITLVADLYKPKDSKEKLPAIACAGPFGAVKEQVSGLYAQTLAEKGFLTIALASYLEQLMAKLKKAGLIKSIRGAQGGYVLAKKSNEISVGDILRALEGDLTPVKCSELDGNSGCSGSDCWFDYFRRIEENCKLCRSCCTFCGS